MYQTICIHGRQPAIGRAELESLFGADAITPIGPQATGISLAPADIDFSRLGGTVKFCKLLTVLDTTDWDKIQEFLESSVPVHAASLPEGKMKLGLSVYGLNVSPRNLTATGLALKKVIKSTGRSVRIVPNSEKVLNSAQVLHNQLTGALGWELVFIQDGKQTVLAQNIAEQDIEAYAARDQSRPKRDARVGMLPPKLAQILINIAAGDISDEPLSASCAERLQNGLGLDAARGSDEERNEPYKEVQRVSTAVADTAQRQEKKRVTSSAREQAFSAKAVLDPFCGTGVVLQEALLMGYDAYGTDLEPRMVDYSKGNLDWLANRYNLDGLTYLLEIGDATSHQWQAFDMIAAETYLGRPFSAEPKPEVLKEVIRDVDTIHKKFLQNLAKQTPAGFRMCIAVPAWKTKSGFKHLPLLDQLTDMGYTRLVLKHVSNEDLVYHRENQIVARELVVLTRV